METRTEIVSVLINNVGSTEFTFPALPNIRDAKNIKTIEAYSAAQVSLNDKGRPVVNAGVFAKSFLQLVSGQNVQLRTLPLASLSPSVNQRPRELNVGSIDPEKSKIVVGSIAGLVVNEVFLLAITYEK